MLDVCVESINNEGSMRTMSDSVFDWGKDSCDCKGDVGKIARGTVNVRSAEPPIPTPEYPHKMAHRQVVQAGKAILLTLDELIERLNGDGGEVDRAAKLELPISPPLAMVFTEISLEAEALKEEVLSRIATIENTLFG